MQNSSFSSGFINDILLSDAKSEYQLVSTTRHSRIYKTTYKGKLLILKTANPDNVDSETSVALLRREYQILSELDHPFIIRTWGLRNDPQIGECIILDYVDGIPLDKFLELKPSHNVRHRIISELLDAVAYLHAKQIAHKDLKPSNILITTNGEHVKLIDFGFSDADSQMANNLGCTTRYASPEQLNGETPDNHVESADIAAKDTILASSLHEGDMVILTWPPDRCCKLQYQGNNKFLITEVEKSHRLCAGCTFSAQSFILNQPLYLNDLCFPDSPDEHSTYGVAFQNGLSSIDVIS